MAKAEKGKRFKEERNFVLSTHNSSYNISENLDMETVCDLLDKTLINHLYLIEEKMRCELNIESNINNGSIHLAKSRYIMGQSSVSVTRLPMESSPEFSASTVCETTEVDNVKQFKIVENESDNTVNPLHWFGVLVPQNLHKAKHIFQNTLNFVVECANIQTQLLENMQHYMMLKQYKKSISL